MAGRSGYGGSIPAICTRGSEAVVLRLMSFHMLRRGLKQTNMLAAARRWYLG